MQFILIAIITTIYFFLAPLFAHLLDDATLIPLFRFSSLIIPSFALASFYFYYYTGIHEFGKQAFLKFTRSIVKVIFIIGLGYYFQAVGAVIGQALAPLTVFIDAYLIDPYRKKKLISDKNGTPSVMVYDFHWKKLLNFAWPIILFMIFYELMITIDLYLVKAILNSDRLTGIYNSALTVGRIPYYAFYFLTIILLPKISQTTSQGLKKETKQTLQHSMKFMFMFLFPIVSILSLFSQSAIRFFYGARYTDAGDPMSILVIGVGFLTVFYVLAFVLNGAGLNKMPMKAALIGAILNFVLNYFFIQAYGLKGSAWATTINSFVVMIFIWIYTSKKITSFIRLKSIFNYFIASLSIYWLGKFIFPQGRFIFMLWSLILLIIYLIILILLKEIKKSDWLIYKELIKSKS